MRVTTVDPRVPYEMRNSEWQAGLEIYDYLRRSSIVNPTLSAIILGLCCRQTIRLTDRFELITCGAEYANVHLFNDQRQGRRFAAQMDKVSDEEAMSNDYDALVC